MGRKLLAQLLCLLFIPASVGVDGTNKLARVAPSITSTTRISRQDFPPGFVFGAGTSAYQVEGAVTEDGRKPSIWDTFTHSGKAFDKSTGDVAADQYHKYKEDVKLMSEMGLDAYRFSISWSRLIPDGRGAVNPKGLQYYNNLINELNGYGIEAHVTLSHFDIPQALEDEYGGYLSRKLIEDFTTFADICFREFGNRVKSWSTFNEPNIHAVLGFDVGQFPPGRCSYPFGLNCSKGNSSTEVYIAAHNILLSHASAVRSYRDKYQEKQKGEIGITLLGFWFEAATNSPEDIAATQRARDFHIGWFLHPLVYGHYPASMRKNVGSRLPSFSVEESKWLKGSLDYIGFNHYTIFYIQNSNVHYEENNRDYLRDVSAKISLQKSPDTKGYFGLNDIGLPIAPWALKRLLEYIKTSYGNPAVIIHENGYGVFSNFPAARASNNVGRTNYNNAARTNYLQAYIESLLQSIRNGSNTKGYFVWSFLDCFENAFGYDARFGLYQVDFDDKDLKRYPRQSAKWYTRFLRRSQSRAISSY